MSASAPTLEQSILTILTTTLTICSILITRYVLPWIKANSHNNKLQLANWMLQRFVEGAEQELAGTKGQVKRAIVIARAQEELEARGIHVRRETLTSLLEAAVRELEVVDSAMGSAPRAPGEVLYRRVGSRFVRVEE